MDGIAILFCMFVHHIVFVFLLVLMLVHLIENAFAEKTLNRAFKTNIYRKTSYSKRYHFYYYYYITKFAVVVEVSCKDVVSRDTGHGKM